MKRPLNQEDFVNIDKSVDQRDEARGGEASSFGQGNVKGPGRDGHYNRQDGFRNGSGYRANEGKIEDGELGLEDYGIEDPNALLTGAISQIDDFLNEPEGEYAEEGETWDFDGETRKDGGYGSENYYQETDGGSPEATG
ncbi:hypothetical protein AALP_AAs50609U000100 [Arabis alpina]|uniref:Uncharacterized protein n=1 Tax=Arabis alpina TaxID=50452 RepID=A0A087FX09_ARAAL|nr:hypothetical protein AALP_AAs50609U000100 [Arabis alpina]